MANNEFEAAVLKWREERAERLRTNEKSWLGLAGLFWLKEGKNTFGNASTCDFVLPNCTARKAGAFIFKGGQVSVEVEPGVKVTCNGEAIPSRPLQDDETDKPDFLLVDHLILVLIRRGESTLIRAWDIDHPLRKNFKGLNFFPYKPEFRLLAKYNGYAPYKIVKQEDIIGEIRDRKMLGYVTFQLDGNEYRLDAEDGGEGLFIAFRDKTNGATTYAGGRYLLTEKLDKDQVVIDFNRSYNMACAYTVYAACDLSTPENRLPIAIEAGEMKYHANQ